MHRETLTLHPHFWEIRAGWARGEALPPSTAGLCSCPRVCPVPAAQFLLIPAILGGAGAAGRIKGVVGTALWRCKTASNSALQEPQSTGLIRDVMSQLHESSTPSHTHTWEGKKYLKSKSESLSCFLMNSHS